MLPQTILRFKLEISDEKLTARAGLALVAESAEGFGLRRAFEKLLPPPGSNRGRDGWTFGRAVLLMLHGGGRTMEDLRTLAADEALREAIGLDVPSPGALRNWLHRLGRDGGEERMQRVNDRLLKRILKQSRVRRHTLDMDATFVEAHKKEAAMSYHGEPGYYPMLGWLAEEELGVRHEFRAGNVTPAADNAGFIERCRASLPEGHTIKLVRSDAAGYRAEVIRTCRGHGMDFLIRAPMNERIRREALLLGNDAWTELPGDLGPGHIAETVTGVGDFGEAVRLIVIRRPKQEELFDTPEFDRDGNRYFALVTSLNDNAFDVVRRYNVRAQAENAIKELKIGYAMERMPCGDFAANAVWLGLGVLAYNLGAAIKLFVLGKEWTWRNVATLRWRLYHTAAKLVRHAGAVILRMSGIAAETFDLLTRARATIHELYLLDDTA